LARYFILYHRDHFRTVNRGDILIYCVDAPRAGNFPQKKIINSILYLARSRTGVNALRMLILICCD